MPLAKRHEFPALITARLALRLPRADDASALRRLLAIPEVTRFTNWPDAPSGAQVRRYARWMATAYASGKGCAWIIEERGRRSVTFLGAIRFNSFEKKWKTGMIGYELDPAHWGRGLMTEAVRAVVTCGHQLFRLNRIEAWTLPGNPASDRVLEKSGFRYEGTARQRAYFKGAFHDFRMFGRIPDDPIDR
jgi:[ribosomal protein S5]-alanine N-acetyltransferase